MDKSMNSQQDLALDITKERINEITRMANVARLAYNQLVLKNSKFMPNDFAELSDFLIDEIFDKLWRLNREIIVTLTSKPKE